MKPGITINPVVARRRKARNKRKSSVNSINNISGITNAKPPENTAAAISNLPTPPVNPALQELEDIERGIEKRIKVKSNALRKITANSQARKSKGNLFKDIVNRSRAVRELENVTGDEFVSNPNPLYNKEKPKSETTPEASKKEPVNARWSKMLENKKKESEQQKPWNPSTKINSPSRFGKGRKRRNRRKTGHHLRNRKKTGRKI
jgi:hypothetical protein